MTRLAWLVALALCASCEQVVELGPIDGSAIPDATGLDGELPDDGRIEPVDAPGLDGTITTDAGVDA